MRSNARPVGDHLREWRQRRRLSQLELACGAEISARHLSFVETGRSRPSREMILHLSEQLQIPMRERNVLLVAAGYAPVFPERPLDDAALLPVRRALDFILTAHRPYPAFAIDRHWKIVASNGALPELYEGVAKHLLTPPPNAMRLSLHPQGLAPKIANFAEWRAHMLARLKEQVGLSADPVLVALLREVSGYPAPNGTGSSGARPAPQEEPNSVAIPFQIATRRGVLSFITTTTVFGTPVDITLSELALELFFPADDETVALIGSRSQQE